MRINSKLDSNSVNGTLMNCSGSSEIQQTTNNVQSPENLNKYHKALTVTLGLIQKFINFGNIV